MDKIGIVIINYCGYDDTIECIESIINQNSIDHILYLIDNKSPDNSGLILKNELGDKCCVILAPENGGFSYGNNIGIRAAKKDGCNKILFLNNDTVIDKDLVKIMADKCDSNTVVVPKTYYYKDPSIIWDTGSVISSFGKWMNRGIDELDKGQYDTEETVHGFTGHCVMIDVETIDKVGLWDEQYFMYAEDTEYSLRMNECGINVLYVPEAKLWHKVSKSSGGVINPKMMYYAVRNRKYVLNLHKVPIIWKIRNCIWSYYLAARYLFFKEDSYKYVLRAINDYKAHVTGKVNFLGDDKKY